MEYNKYIIPELVVLEVYAGGVLCGSTAMDRTGGIAGLLLAGWAEVETPMEAVSVIAVIEGGFRQQTEVLSEPFSLARTSGTQTLARHCRIDRQSMADLSQASGLCLGACFYGQTVKERVLPE